MKNDRADNAMSRRHIIATIPRPLAMLLALLTLFDVSASALSAAGGASGAAAPAATSPTSPAFVPRGSSKKKKRSSSSSSSSTSSSSSSSGGGISTGQSSASATTGGEGQVGGGTAQPLSQAVDIDEVCDAPLMADIELLSGMLAEVVRRDDPDVHELYTQLRKHGMDRAADPNDKRPFDAMRQLAIDLSPHDALAVMRTFSIALNLVNAAEVHHRLRVMRQDELTASTQMGKHVGPLPMTEDSVRGTFEIILAEGRDEGEADGAGENDNGDGNGKKKKKKMTTEDEIFEKLLNQRVEIVLTAHPTEVNRKTLLRKYRKISETLGVLDRPDLHPYERSEALTTLRRIIAAIWGSDEIRRKKPTPQQEAAGGCAVIESVLWDAVPSYLRKLDAQCRISLGRRLPIDAVPIRFASWIGGDRDGNPNVTPEVTREVITHQRLRAARLFLMDLDELYNELAVSSRYSDEMLALADSIEHSPDYREKYRRVIGYLRLRLVKTVKECEAELAAMGVNGRLHGSGYYDTSGRGLVGWEDVESIKDAETLMRPLRIMYDSLISTGFELVADGRLADIIRRLSVFGMTLVRLDIREESTRHTAALDAITRYLGVGSYKEWNEGARLNFLQAELAGKRPLFRTRDVANLGFDDDVVKTLRVFDVASSLGPESLGAYVISQAQTASDVLAVMLLQKQFGMTEANGKLMRVVPLFETLDDLTNAPERLETLFSIPSYVGAIKGKQEVMVGYSDSAKDAGRLSALWAQYTSQERMAKVASKYNVELTFFHGKGGTVGRGGNPALYRAILSHPPNTINGRFRVTEQGEMITQNFGSPDIAERTLDIYTAAVLREAFTEHVVPTDEWREQMERLSEVSCADYRHMVREEPRFVPYFRQATPELELGSLNIGSRPAKRNPKGGIESLRAIPWTFAWTQTRLHLSAWLGVGEGLNAKGEKDRKELREMYLNWPWFRENIDLIAMILSKTDFSISKNYDDLLVDKSDDALVGLGDEVRNKLVETRQAVLDVTGSQDVAGPHVALLRASTKIRFPYVDSINVVQAELLKELRNMPGDDEEGVPPEVREIQNVRRDALVLSVKGIAQGMRNSG